MGPAPLFPFEPSPQYPRKAKGVLTCRTKWQRKSAGKGARLLDRFKAAVGQLCLDRARPLIGGKALRKVASCLQAHASKRLGARRVCVEHELAQQTLHAVSQHSAWCSAAQLTQAHDTTCRCCMRQAGSARAHTR